MAGGPRGVRRPGSNPGVIAAGLAALGVGGGVLTKRRRDARRRTGLLGVVEPQKLRHRDWRRRFLRRIRILR